MGIENAAEQALQDVIPHTLNVSGILENISDAFQQAFQPGREAAQAINGATAEIGQMQGGAFAQAFEALMKNMDMKDKVAGIDLSSLGKMTDAGPESWVNKVDVARSAQNLGSGFGRFS